MSEERWAEAISVFLSEPELVTSSWEVAWNAGWAHFKIGEYAKAIELLSRSTEIAPQNAMAWWALGTVQQKADNLEAAEINFRRALALKDSALARQSLALVLMKQERWSEAETVHTEGIELRPESGSRWKSYGAFLSDSGRREEALNAYRRYRTLRNGCELVLRAAQLCVHRSRASCFL